MMGRNIQINTGKSRLFLLLFQGSKHIINLQSNIYSLSCLDTLLAVTTWLPILACTENISSSTQLSPTYPNTEPLSLPPKCHPICPLPNFLLKKKKINKCNKFNFRCATSHSKNCKQALVKTGNEWFTSLWRNFDPLFFAKLL